MVFFIIKENVCFIFVKMTISALLTTAGLGSKNSQIKLFFRKPKKIKSSDHSFTMCR